MLSFPPNGSHKSPAEILAIVVEIIDAVYPEYQSVSAYHADSNAPHTLPYTRQLKAMGVEVLFINDNIRTYGEICLTIMATLA